MIELPQEISSDFFRPMVTGWVSKLSASKTARATWEEQASECRMFYNRSAAAMWDENYAKKFWRGVKPPKFRITMNLAYEYVAVIAPFLQWDMPHRNVKPKRMVDMPSQLLGGDESELYQQYVQENQQTELVNQCIAFLMQDRLNYTAREQTSGGLLGHSERALFDALLTGRGCLWPRPYRKEGSRSVLTGCFHAPPEDLFTDPDFRSLEQCKWIALKHVDPHWAVERRFKLEPNSLRGRASLESSWNRGESAGNPYGGMWRAAGQTNDLVVWYEVFSKTGVGARLTGMHQGIRDQLEKAVGDYAYLAICANVPYPLNCSPEFLRRGATTEEVRERFRWPVPFWADGRWPVNCLDFYPNTDPMDPSAAWPVPPLAPAMGEIKLLNFLIPWLCNRIWNSSRDFWAIASAHVKEYEEYLQKGEDQTVIPTPPMVEDVRQAVQLITQPEVRADVWRIIDIVTDLFRMRTGLIPYAYGMNEGGTQSRTAEDALSKREAVGSRPQYMQKRVVAWHGEVAASEAIVTRRFVQGSDVEPRFGRVGRMLWERYVMSTSMERTIREMEYTISASSIRKPNRDRDIANFTQVQQYWLAVMQEYAAQNNNWEPINGLMRKWAELHDEDVEELLLPPPEPDPEQEALQQQQIALEQQKLTTDIRKAEIDLQKTLIEAQVQQATGGLDVAGKQLELQFDQEKHTQELRQDQIKHALDMLQDRRKFEQDLTQAREMATIKARQARSSGGSKNGSK